MLHMYINVRISAKNRKLVEISVSSEGLWIDTAGSAYSRWAGQLF